MPEKPFSIGPVLINSIPMPAVVVSLVCDLGEWRYAKTTGTTTNEAISNAVRTVKERFQRSPKG
jgi:hypothetical protein